jgi:phage-related protein
LRLKLLAAEIWTVYAPCDADGTTFIDGLGATELEKLTANLERIAEHGPRVIPESRNHQVDAKEQLFQLRIDAIRVIWFYDAGRVVVCAHSYEKKSQKVPKGEVEAARKVKAAYLDAIAKKQIEVIED